MRLSMVSKWPSRAAAAPKNISPSKPKIRICGFGGSPSNRSRMMPSEQTVNSVNSILPARGTVSMHDMKTPTSTQNSMLMPIAARAVTPTTTASKREARTWYTSRFQSTMYQDEIIRMPAMDAWGMNLA